MQYRDIVNSLGGIDFLEKLASMPKRELRLTLNYYFSKLSIPVDERKYIIDKFKEGITYLKNIREYYPKFEGINEYKTELL